jgi:hypothetical protein
MPWACTTSWSPFPPRTREAQLDEKWAFVAKKEANCDPDDPADARKGDHWDHVALDPDHRLVVCVVPGKRTAEDTAALARSASSRAINTSFVGRQNGTDRNRNARKARKTYGSSKDWSVHQSITYFTMYSYNFCWAVRTLRIKGEEETWQRRTPAMAAGLADHVWSLSEWLTLPAVHRK